MGPCLFCTGNKNHRAALLGASLGALGGFMYGFQNSIGMWIPGTIADTPKPP